MFWILIFGLLGFSVTAAYRGINLLNWTIGMALVLVGFAVFTNVSMLAIVVLSLLFAVVAVPLNFKSLRRQWLSAPFLAVYRKMLPTLSDTEKVALEAGTVGWEGELFAGNPNWDIAGTILATAEQGRAGFCRWPGRRVVQNAQPLGKLTRTC